MTKTEIKKQELISWIRYKMQKGGDGFTEICKTIERCKKMSYKALKKWAGQTAFFAAAAM